MISISSRLGSSRVVRVSASVALTVAVAAGATLATTSPTAAVGTSACSAHRYDFNSKITGSNVNFRSGPGTGHSSEGLLAKGTKNIWRCSTPDKANAWSWKYIKVTSGPHSGTWGWVRSDFSLVV